MLNRFLNVLFFIPMFFIFVLVINVLYPIFSYIFRGENLNECSYKIIDLDLLELEYNKNIVINTVIIIYKLFKGEI